MAKNIGNLPKYCMDKYQLLFSDWLLAREAMAPMQPGIGMPNAQGQMPEIKAAVQTAVGSGKDAKQAVQNAIKAKLSKPGTAPDEIAQLAKMSDELQKGRPGSMPGATSTGSSGSGLR